MIIQFILIVLTSFLIVAWHFVSRPKNFPPGPPRLPIFGGLLYVGNPPHRGLKQLITKYGVIFGVYCGNYPAVVLNDLQLIKDAFKDDRISARPPLRPFLERSWGYRKGLIFGSGNEWAEQRKFSITAFKRLGFGTSKMEKSILDEILELVKKLNSEVDNAISVNHYFHVAIINTLWSIIAGKRFMYDDPDLKKLIDKTGHVVRFRSLDANSFMPMILFFMPWMTKLFPNLSGWNLFLSSFKSIFPFLQKYIDEHKLQLDGKNSKDFIDLYLQQIQNTSDSNSSFYKENGETSLLIVLLDIFVAGGETASSNLTWAILFLAMYPSVQKRAHEELEKKVEKGRLPSVADKVKMPYTKAVINEVLRMVTIGALSIFHSTSEEIQNFHGYTLPKDCIVFGNFWQVHHDTKVWGDPQNFRPERFLDDPSKNNLLHVFSTGKRICPGMSLAMDELFLFITALLQKFSFERDPNSPPPILDPMKAAVLRSHSSKVIIRRRDVKL